MLEPLYTAAEMRAAEERYPNYPDSVPELMDLSRESADTLAMYGCKPAEPGYARNCLLARRLIERGVRFVTVNMFETVFDEITWDIHGSKPFTDITEMSRLVAPNFDENQIGIGQADHLSNALTRAVKNGFQLFGMQCRSRQLRQQIRLHPPLVRLGLLWACAATTSRCARRRCALATTSSATLAVTLATSAVLAASPIEESPRCPGWTGAAQRMR